MKKNVAVIMCVYRSDSLEYLKVAVESILDQSYKQISLFIYRDGEVPSDIEDFLSKLIIDNNRVQLYCFNVNQGLAHGLNYLIDIIVGNGLFDYIARMDSDDISRFERIEKQVAFLEKNLDIDVCGSSCREFGASFALEEKKLPQLHSSLIDYSITHCPFIHPTVMFRSYVFKSNIRYPTDTSLTEDMAFWFILLEQGYKLANLDDVLLEYRLNENTLKRRKGIGKAFGEFKLRIKHMFRLKRVSIKNIILVSFRLFFHLMPTFVLKLLYKYCR